MLPIPDSRVNQISSDLSWSKSSILVYYAFEPPVKGYSQDNPVGSSLSWVCAGIHVIIIRSAIFQNYHEKITCSFLPHHYQQ